MSVYKRGNTWTARVWINEDESESKGGFSTKKEATIFEQELSLKIKRDGIKNNNVKFYEYVENWVITYKKDRVSDHSYYIYTNIEKEIFKVLGDIALKDMDKMTYQRFIDVYASTHVKTSVQKINSRIRRIVADAIDERLIQRDFTRNVIISGLESKNNELKFLETQNLINLNNKCIEELSFSAITKYIVLTGIHTGARYGEIVCLTWNDIDFEKSKININKTYDYHTHSGFKATKTKSSIRIIDIDQTLLDILKS